MPALGALEATAVRQLFEQHGPRVYRRALRILGNAADAEEALQEVFIRVMRGAEGFESRSEITTWLYRITTNYCLNMVRSERRAHGLLALGGLRGQTVAGEGMTPQLVLGYSLDFPWSTAGVRLRGARAESEAVDGTSRGKHDELGLGFAFSRVTELRWFSAGFGVTLEGVYHHQTREGSDQHITRCPTASASAPSPRWSATSWRARRCVSRAGRSRCCIARPRSRRARGGRAGRQRADHGAHLLGCCRRGVAPVSLFPRVLALVLVLEGLGASGDPLVDEEFRGTLSTFLRGRATVEGEPNSTDGGPLKRAPQWRLRRYDCGQSPTAGGPRV
jgi:hypothetical protein